MERLVTININLHTHTKPRFSKQQNAIALYKLQKI